MAGDPIPRDHPGPAAPVTYTVATAPVPADPALRERLLARERAWRAESAAQYLRSLGYTVIPPGEC